MSTTNLYTYPHIGGGASSSLDLSAVPRNTTMTTNQSDNNNGFFTDDGVPIRAKFRLSRDVLPLRYHLQFDLPFHNTKKGKEGIAQKVNGATEIFCTTRTIDPSNPCSHNDYNQKQSVPYPLLGTAALAPSNASSFFLHAFGLTIDSATLRATNAPPIDKSMAIVDNLMMNAKGGGSSSPSDAAGSSPPTNNNAGESFETVCEEQLPATGALGMSIDLPDGVKYVSAAASSSAPNDGEEGEEEVAPIPVVITPFPDAELIKIATADGSPLPDNFSLLLFYQTPLSQSAKDDTRAMFVTNPDDGNFISTQLEPTLARALYPCFDEPTYKANFKMALYLHPSYQAVSNTPCENVHRIPKALATGRYDEEEEGAAGADHPSSTTTATAAAGGNDATTTNGGAATPSVSPTDDGSPNSTIIENNTTTLGALAGGGIDTIVSPLDGLIGGGGGGGLSLGNPSAGGGLSLAGGFGCTPPAALTLTLGGGNSALDPLLTSHTTATTDGAASTNNNINNNNTATGIINGTEGGATTTNAAAAAAAASVDAATVARDTWRYRYTFYETPKICPYLVSFATGDFHVIETQTKRGLTTRVIFPKTSNSNSGLYAVDLLKKAIEFFEAFFNFQLPVAKIDIVALQEMRPLGMENWAMITLNSAYSLVDEKTSLERRQRIARLIGHEVAHQWFGNIVSIGWWDEIWLKEGFCRYLEFVFVHQVFPKWHIWGEFIAKISDVALSMDSDPKQTHPVMCSHCLHDPRRIFDKFDTISYGKGASILRMVASLVGDKAMAGALASLVHAHAFGNFNTADFLRCVRQHYSVAAVDPGAGGADIDALVTQWITTPNHPLIYVDMDAEGNYKVSQYEMCDLTSGLLPDIIDASIVRIGRNPSATPLGAFVAGDLKSGSSFSPLSPGKTLGRSGGMHHVASTSDFVVEMGGRHRHGSISTVCTRFQYDPSEILQHCNFTIPIRAVTLVQGQTSSSRFLFICNNVTNINMGGGGGGGCIDDPNAMAPVLYFNFNGCGVFRCDFTTKLWHQIFTVAPYLTHIDRLIITQSLFRFRTIHLGSAAPCRTNGSTTPDGDGGQFTGIDDGSTANSSSNNINNGGEVGGGGAVLATTGLLTEDRCLLLLKWLLSFSAGHPQQLNATTWSVIAAELAPIVYLLKGSPCWDEFCQFVHHLFAPLIVDGLVSLSYRENSADFQATRSISSETCNNILHLLAVTKCPALDDEARAVFRWVMASIATVEGLGAAAAGLEILGTASLSSAAVGSGNNNANGNATNSGVATNTAAGGGGVDPLVLSNNNNMTTLSGGGVGAATVGASSASIGGAAAAAAAGVTPNNNDDGGDHHPALKSPFDINDEIHKARAFAALEVLCEGGNTTEWWILLSACLQLLGMRWEDLSTTKRSHVKNQSSNGGPHGNGMTPTVSNGGGFAPISLGGMGVGAAPNAMAGGGGCIGAGASGLLSPQQHDADPLLGSADHQHHHGHHQHGVSNPLFTDSVDNVATMTMIFSPPTDITVTVKPSILTGNAAASPSTTTADGAAKTTTTTSGGAASSASASSSSSDNNAAGRQKLLQLLLPAVLSYEDWSTCPPIAALALKIAGMTTPMAKSIMRNPNLMLEMLALGQHRISSKFLLSFCSLAGSSSAHFEVISGLREATMAAIESAMAAAVNAANEKGIAAAVAMQVSLETHSQMMDLNLAWAQYVVPHYASYLNGLRRIMGRHSRTDSEILVGSGGLVIGGGGGGGNNGGGGAGVAASGGSITPVPTYLSMSHAPQHNTVGGGGVGGNNAGVALASSLVTASSGIILGGGIESCSNIGDELEI